MIEYIQTIEELNFKIQQQITELDGQIQNLKRKRLQLLKTKIRNEKMIGRPRCPICQSLDHKVQECSKRKQRKGKKYRHKKDCYAYNTRDYETVLCSCRQAR